MSDQGSMPEPIEQVWYTWALKGLQSTGYQALAASRGLKASLQDVRYQTLKERFFGYGLPRGTDGLTYHERPGNAPLSLGFFKEPARNPNEEGHEKRVLLGKRFAGLDSFSRSFHFVHVLAGLPPEPQKFSARDAARAWRSDFWCLSEDESKKKEVIDPLTLPQIDDAHVLKQKLGIPQGIPSAVITDHVRTGSSTTLLVSSMGDSLLFVIEAFLALESEQRLFIADTPDRVAALILGLTESLPEELLKELTFSTYEREPERSQGKIVGTSWPELEQGGGQDPIPGAYYLAPNGSALALNPYSHPPKHSPLPSQASLSPSLKPSSAVFAEYAVNSFKDPGHGWLLELRQLAESDPGFINDVPTFLDLADFFMGRVTFAPITRRQLAVILHLRKMAEQHLLKDVVQQALVNEVNAVSTWWRDEGVFCLKRLAYYPEGDAGTLPERAKTQEPRFRAGSLRSELHALEAKAVPLAREALQRVVQGQNAPEAEYWLNLLVYIAPPALVPAPWVALHHALAQSGPGKLGWEQHTILLWAWGVLKAQGQPMARPDEWLKVSLEHLGDLLDLELPGAWFEYASDVASGGSLRKRDSRVENLLKKLVAGDQHQQQQAVKLYGRLIGPAYENREDLLRSLLAEAGTNKSLVAHLLQEAESTPAAQQPAPTFYNLVTNLVSVAQPPTLEVIRLMADPPHDHLQGTLIDYFCADQGWWSNEGKALAPNADLEKLLKKLVTGNPRQQQRAVKVWQCIVQARYKDRFSLLYRLLGVDAMTPGLAGRLMRTASVTGSEMMSLIVKPPINPFAPVLVEIFLTRPVWWEREGRSLLEQTLRARPSTRALVEASRNPFKKLRALWSSRKARRNAREQAITAFREETFAQLHHAISTSNAANLAHLTEALTPLAPPQQYPQWWLQLAEQPVPAANLPWLARKPLVRQLNTIASFFVGRQPGFWVTVTWDQLEDLLAEPLPLEWKLNALETLLQPLPAVLPTSITSLVERHQDEFEYFLTTLVTRGRLDDQVVYFFDQIVRGGYTGKERLFEGLARQALPKPLLLENLLKVARLPRMEPPPPAEITRLVETCAALFKGARTLPSTYRGWVEDYLEQLNVADFPRLNDYRYTPLQDIASYAVAQQTDLDLHKRFVTLAQRAQEQAAIALHAGTEEPEALFWLSVLAVKTDTFRSLAYAPPTQRPPDEWVALLRSTQAPHPAITFQTRLYLLKRWATIPQVKLEDVRQWLKITWNDLALLVANTEPQGKLPEAWRDDTIQWSILRQAPKSLSAEDARLIADQHLIVEDNLVALFHDEPTQKLALDFFTQLAAADYRYKLQALPRFLEECGRGQQEDSVPPEQVIDLATLTRAQMETFYTEYLPTMRQRAYVAPRFLDRLESYLLEKMSGKPKRTFRQRVGGGLKRFLGFLFRREKKPPTPPGPAGGGAVGIWPQSGQPQIAAPSPANAEQGIKNYFANPSFDEVSLATLAANMAAVSSRRKRRAWRRKLTTLLGDRIFDDNTLKAVMDSRLALVWGITELELLKTLARRASKGHLSTPLQAAYIKMALQLTIAAPSARTSDNELTRVLEHLKVLPAPGNLDGNKGKAWIRSLQEISEQAAYWPDSGLAVAWNRYYKDHFPKDIYISPFQPQQGYASQNMGASQRQKRGGFWEWIEESPSFPYIAGVLFLALAGVVVFCIYLLVVEHVF